MPDQFDHPKAEDLIEGLTSDLGVGDDFFDDAKIQEQNKENWQNVVDEKKELADAYHAVFSTNQGKRVMEDLLNITLRKSSFVDMTPEGVLTSALESVPHGFVREGQNQIMRYILGNMRYSQFGGQAAPDKSKPKEINNGPKT